jgi:GntR family transcriptional repressor for pyruvate dehydrogenase complex
MRELFSSIQLDDGILSARAAQQIQDLVRSGDLRGGDRLPSERELSEYLGVSRTVVREAIKLLKAVGLVRVKQGVGTFIAEPGPDALEAPISAFMGSGPKVISDLHQVREILEPQIAVLAAQSITDDQIAGLEQSLREMEDNLLQLQKHIEADQRFHSILAEATQNSVLQLLVYSIVDLTQKERHLSFASAGATERGCYHHRRILEAIRSRDPEWTRQEMQAHLKQIRDDITPNLRSLLPLHEPQAQFDAAPDAEPARH